MTNKLYNRELTTNWLRIAKLSVQCNISKKDLLIALKNLTKNYRILKKNSSCAYIEYETGCKAWVALSLTAFKTRTEYDYFTKLHKLQLEYQKYYGKIDFCR